MKLNLKLSTIILLFFITINCKAQIPVDMKSALQNKTWIIGPDTKTTMKFTSTNMIISVNNIVKGSSEYHFTDTICSEVIFDKSKVGVVTNGRYIITEQGCYLIQFINEDSFKMGPVTNNELDQWQTFHVLE